MAFRLTTKSQRVAAITVAAVIAVLSLASTVRASATPTTPAGTVVKAMSTATYGSVLVAGSGRLAGYPLYAVSSDAGGKFGCSIKPALGYDVSEGVTTQLPCTGPELDAMCFDDCPIAFWPALTTTAAPVAGSGVHQDLLGAAATGIHNLICITGDPPKMGNYPDATAVFDVDSIGLVNIVRNLNRGLDLGGNPIGVGTGFVIGVGANPGLPNLDEEIKRFEFKVEAGAEYVVTQPVFDLGLLENFLRRIEPCRIPVIAGIWPLVSARNAEFMKNELRVSVPDEVLNRMARASTPQAAREEGVAIAREMLSALRDRVQGAQISAPQGRYSSAVDVLEALGSK